MKNVLALAISLLIPAIPVLADVAPDQAKQAATADAKMTANADKTQKLLLADSPDAPAVPTGVPVDRGAAQPVQTAPAPQAAKRADPAVNANLVDETQNAKPKGSFFSGMKKKLMGFLDKHPLIVGMILGGLIGAVLAGPAGFVIGASLGAVAGDLAHHHFKKN